MVNFTKHVKHYLLGKEFVLVTDYNSLQTGKDILKMCAVQEILSSLERKQEGR